MEVVSPDGTRIACFGDFAARVRPLEQRLRGDDWADAVMEIERDLVLEPWDAIADLEQRVREFPRLRPSRG